MHFLIIFLLDVDDSLHLFLLFHHFLELVNHIEVFLHIVTMLLQQVSHCLSLFLYFILQLIIGFSIILCILQLLSLDLEFLVQFLNLLLILFKVV